MGRTGINLEKKNETFSSFRLWNTQSRTYVICARTESDQDRDEQGRYSLQAEESGGGRWGLRNVGSR
jgi:hypothetical protein